MRGSRGLGVTLVVAFAVLLTACVSGPPWAPQDPQIPGESDAPVVFTDAAPPPSTAGPSVSPVPTDAPGDYQLGETVVIHTSQGSTWEITPHRSIDPADDLMRTNGEVPPVGSRFVILDVTVENVGVITTHPYYDVIFSYQPQHGPLYNQNSASQWAAPDDLGYGTFAPGTRVEHAQVVVLIPASSATGSWVISGDTGTTVYTFR